MKILIVKTSSLGDLIQCFPTLSYLRKRFPDAQIDWAVEETCADLINAHPQVDQSILLYTKKWRKNFFSFSTLKQIRNFFKILRKARYDVIFDLQGNLKSSLVLILALAKKRVGFGWGAISEWPAFFFTSCRITPPKGQNIREDYLSIVKGYFNDKTFSEEESLVELSLEKSQFEWLESFFSEEIAPILVCPGSAWKNKRVPFENLLAILKQFEDKPFLFAWGNEEEKKVASKLAAHFPNSRLLEKLPLPLLQHVMARSHLVVTMDSLPLHLCGTTSTSSLSFFGPSSADKYKPLGKQHEALQGACPYGITFEKRCPRLRTCKTGACINAQIIRTDESFLSEEAHQYSRWD